MLLYLPELSKSDPQPNMHEHNVFSRFSELFTRLNIVGFYQIIACVLPSSYFWTTSNLDHLLLFSFTNITILNFFTDLLLFPNRPIQTGRVKAGCVFECSTVFVNILPNRHSGRFTSQTARLFLAFWTRGVLLFQHVGHIYSSMLIYPLWSGLASVDCLELLTKPLLFGPDNAPLGGENAEKGEGGEMSEEWACAWWKKPKLGGLTFCASHENRNIPETMQM